MEFREVVRRRFMCRSFEDREVPEEKVEAILDAARRFPSAGHTQPQEFILVRDPGVKDALGRAALGQMFLARAPIVIAVVSDVDRSAAVYGERGVRFYSILDGGFASML
ncbi:MAG TPA: nitroreductase family protein, partial [Actinomycetota bacterium]